MKKSEEKKPKIAKLEKYSPDKRKMSLGKRNKQRGNEYERRIAKELTEIGFDVVTARSESKSADANKIDLIDRKNILPCKIQLKRSISTPSYFKIREESTVPNEEFCLIWNKQKKVNDRFLSEGECVILDKALFYKLLMLYLHA